MPLRKRQEVQEVLRQIIKSEINIRPAVPGDCRELALIKRKVWETTYRGIYPDRKLDDYDVKSQVEKFLKILSNPEIKLFVATKEEKIIGYMSCGAPVRPFGDYKQEIGLLYVLQEYQGHGLGKTFFELGAREIGKRGYEEFFISCNKFNSNARKFYGHMGGKLVHTDEDKADRSEVQVKYHYTIKKDTI